MAVSKLKLNLETHFNFSINNIEEYNDVTLEVNKNYVIPEKYIILSDPKLSSPGKYGATPEEKYGFKILKKYGNLVEIESNGYNHVIPFSAISRFSGNIKTMTLESKLKFINNNSFLNTDLRAINITNSSSGSIIDVINTKTNESSRCRNFTNPNIKQLLSNTTKKSKYLDRIKDSLGDFYNYSKTKCSCTRDKAIVTCPIHGDFEITVSNTLNLGCGCNKCSLEKRGFGRSKFVNRCNDNGVDGILYLIKCKSNSELFYKIGITSVSVKSRMINIPYKSTILIEINGDASSIYDLEIVLHRKFANNSYFPKLKFKGRTECFEFNNESEIISIISNYKNIL